MDAGGKWIKRIKAESGYRETVDIVDTEDTCGQWIQRNSRYSGCTQLKISEFSADPCKNSNVNNEAPHSKNRK